MFSLFMSELKEGLPSLLENKLNISASSEIVGFFFCTQGILLIFAEIYRKVKNGQRPYFRPTLDHLDDDECSEELANMIKKCWSEDPMERPDFHSLKTIIRKINK